MIYGHNRNGNLAEIDTAINATAVVTADEATENDETLPKETEE